MKVLIVSNMDSSRPFGQFLRPYFIGRALADSGLEVANVGIDCHKVDFGPAWSVGRRSLVRLARGASLARRRFDPDLIYAHEMRPMMAALLSTRGLPLAVDFHSLTSVEWSGYAASAKGADIFRYRAASLRSSLAEVLATRRADRIFCAGEQVALRIAERYHPRAELVTVPNGVDPALLAGALNGGSPFGGDADHHVVATVPAGVSPSNERALEFIHAVAVELEALSPRVMVHVLGTDEGNPAPLLRYEGFVPELLPWVAKADAGLLPYPADAALCGGARNKLLEFLARGRRVVTTEEGLRGLEEAAAWTGVCVAPYHPAEFARAVVEAVGPEAAELDPGSNAYELSWDARGRTIEQSLRALADAAVA